MQLTGTFWLIIAILSLFLLFFAWKKGMVKKQNYKGLIYVGLIFIAVGFFEKIRYGEGDLLVLGLLLLGAAWFSRKKKKGSRK